MTKLFSINKNLGGAGSSWLGLPQRFCRPDNAIATASMWGLGLSGEGYVWSYRLVFLIGVSKAVHSVHSGLIPGLFNNQLKENNVLLDEHQAKRESHKWYIYGDQGRYDVASEDSSYSDDSNPSTN
ncbi:uncharacterized protein LOC122059917 isoform X1 [Macadamia integrifolia]|uniref:uncharacterized protein LOC122059917 isoform X1 n=1 Tax=Macadamia integrifolia TaxID=60698 RepID=UPI001C52D285|nr:uncharacterized protein LOC122059917 isoform X1 [Macadamia integrifolia]